MAFRAYIFGIWMILTVLQGVLAQAFVSDEYTALNNVLQFNVFSTWELFGKFAIPTFNPQFFVDLAKLLLWDFDLFTGDFQWVRWGLLLPLGGAIGFVMVRDVGPVLLQAIATARNFFRFP